MMKKSKTLKKYMFAFILFSCSYSYSQLSKQEASWIEKNIKPIESLTQANNNSDLAFLDKELKNTRIFLIGESSHGTKEFYQIKTRIVKYLHKKLGFDVLLMESGLAETFAAFADVYAGTDTALMKRTQFQNFQCTEFLELFSYIKQNAFTNNELKLAGLDVQNSSGYFAGFLHKLLSHFDTSFAKKALETLRKGPRLPQLYTDSLAFTRVRDEYLKGLAELKLFISEHSTEIQKQYSSYYHITEYLHRVVDNLVAFYNTIPGDFDGKGGTPMKRVLLRDKIMADNIFWYTDVLFANKKIIIWAHNAHISKSHSVDGGKMTGEYVAEKFDKKAYSLGIFSLRGETYQFWDKSTVQFNNTSDSSLEKRLSNHFSTGGGYLGIHNIKKNKNTAWLFNTHKVYELEMGREHDIIAALRHDGILIIRNSSLPTYIWKK